MTADSAKFFILKFSNGEKTDSCFLSDFTLKNPYIPHVSSKFCRGGRNSFQKGQGME